jgi:predicted MFS family arabinose efflux permease
MRSYLEILNIQGAWRLILSSIPGRLSYGISGLALFFHVQQLTDSLAVAGYAIGAFSGVSALTAAPRGHAIDRWGQTRPLLLLVPAFTIACTLVGFVAKDTLTSVVFAGLMGLTAPPINLSMRPLWVALVSPTQIRTAYALDSIILNTTSLIGPVIGTWLALTFSGVVAMTVTGGLMLIGGIALITSKISREWIPETKVEGERSLFKSPAMRLLAVEAVLVGLAYGLFDVAIPSAATLAGIAGWAAPTLAAVAFGGLIGGALAGSRFKNLSPALGVTLCSYVFAIISIPLYLLSPGWPTALLVLVAGFPLGMAQVFYLEVVDIVRPRGAAVAAMGSIWMIEGSAMAAGSAIAGVIAEHYNPDIAFVGVTVLFLLGAFVFHYGTKNVLSPAMVVNHHHADDIVD